MLSIVADDQFKSTIFSVSVVYVLASNPGRLTVSIACVINHRRGPYTPTYYLLTMYVYEAL